MAPDDMMDEETPSGSQSDRRTSLSINVPDVLGVNQLLESVKMKCLSFLSKNLTDWHFDCILNQFLCFCWRMNNGILLLLMIYGDTIIWIGFGNCSASCKLLHFLKYFTL